MCNRHGFMHVVRLAILIIVLVFSGIGLLVFYSSVTGLLKYGYLNPAYHINIVAAVIIFAECLRCVLMLIFKRSVKYLKSHNVIFGLIIVLFAASSGFEFMIMSSHVLQLQDGALMNRTFYTYGARNLIASVGVARTQADARCCGYADKRVWRVLRFDESFRDDSSHEKDRLYPSQCCAADVSPCSGDNVFDSPCNSFGADLLAELQTNISDRYMFNTSVTLFWLGVYLLFLLMGYLYREMLFTEMLDNLATSVPSSMYDISTYK